MLTLTKRLKIWFLPNCRSFVCSTKILRQCCSFIKSHVQLSPKICIFIAVLQHYAVYKPIYHCPRDLKFGLYQIDISLCVQVKFHVNAACLLEAMFK